MIGPMTLGARIEERRKAVGIRTQSELARKAEVGQSTLNGLINKPYRWSPHLTRLARTLGTTVEYLTGEIDDPNVGAPPPLPAAQHQLVMLPVALPTETMLARMFAGLLASLTGPGGIENLDTVDQAALSHELATLLPTGLGTLRGPLRLPATAADDVLPAPLAIDEAEAPRRRRASRT